MEGADPIHAPSDLEEFHAMGVRIIALAWDDKNRYASGTDTGEGLSAAGMELIEKMNDLNIVLDLSHLNEKCFWQAIDITASIPIASHSNSMSLCSHPRNLTDEQVTAVAEKGGVIGILLYSPFLNSGITRATLHDVFLHTDHMVRLVGEDHVGIGTDLDGAEIGAFPEEIQTVADLPKIADTLRNNGYGEERVKKIMGENFIRVIRENFQRA